MIASVSLFTDWLKKILNQSEAKLKPVATRSGAFFCAAEHILFSLAHEIHLFFCSVNVISLIFVSRHLIKMHSKQLQDSFKFYNLSSRTINGFVVIRKIKVH